MRTEAENVERPSLNDELNDLVHECQWLAAHHPDGDIGDFALAVEGFAKAVVLHLTTPADVEGETKGQQ